MTILTDPTIESVKSELQPHLACAVELAETVFKPVHPIELDLEVDPDTGQRRILIEVTVDASVEQALQMKRAYTSEWVQAAVPPAIRERIRLLYNLL